MLLVHPVHLRIIERRVASYTAAETVDAFEVRLHVRFPLALGPTVAAVLKTNGRIYRERGRAIRIRRVHVIFQSITCDAHIVLLVKIVKLGAGERLLLYANTHRFLLGCDFLGVAEIAGVTSSTEVKYLAVFIIC
jgi:hypothetical protein